MTWITSPFSASTPVPKRTCFPLFLPRLGSSRSCKLSLCVEVTIISISLGCATIKKSSTRRNRNAKFCLIASPITCRYEKVLHWKKMKLKVSHCTIVCTIVIWGSTARVQAGPGAAKTKIFISQYNVTFTSGFKANTTHDSAKPV